MISQSYGAANYPHASPVKSATVSYKPYQVYTKRGSPPVLQWQASGLEKGFGTVQDHTNCNKA